MLVVAGILSSCFYTFRCCLIMTVDDIEHDGNDDDEYDDSYCFLDMFSET